MHAMLCCINCSCCRNRCNSCCSFMCIYLSFVIIIIAVFIFVLAVVIWSFTFPSNVKFHVTEASLKQFNLTANNTLFYNLTLNFTARNPSKRVAFDYKRITVTAYYNEKQFDKVDLAVTPFHQAHKNTTLLMEVIQGQQVLKLKSRDVTEYNKETSAGVYNIDVNMDLRVRKKVGMIKYHESWNLVCNLKVPMMSSNDTSDIPFNTTNCKSPPNEDASADVPTNIGSGFPGRS